MDMYKDFDPKLISEREREEASFAYVMTLMTVMVGLPFPIINLFACLIYFFAQDSKSPFVRYHVFQAVVSQLVLIIINTIAISWTLKVIFSDATINNLYIGYLLAVIITNLCDYAVNIIAAIKARKGKIYHYTFFGTIAYMLYLKPENTGDHVA
jgi:uncharacterized Tic20 family protein